MRPDCDPPCPSCVFLSRLPALREENPAKTTRSLRIENKVVLEHERIEGSVTGDKISVVVTTLPGKGFAGSEMLARVVAMRFGARPGFFSVMSAGAVHGWGPFAYDVLMEKATELGSALAPDIGESAVSPEAQAVWGHYAHRSDVWAKELSDAPRFVGDNAYQKKPTTLAVLRRQSRFSERLDNPSDSRITIDKFPKVEPGNEDGGAEARFEGRPVATIFREFDYKDIGTVSHRVRNVVRLYRVELLATDAEIDTGTLDDPEFKTLAEATKFIRDNAAARDRMLREERKDNPASIELPEDVWRYFHPVPGVMLVDVSTLETTRARAGGIERAEALMREAYEGRGGTRKPIDVSPIVDAAGVARGWRVEDGNSTTAIAKKHGWRFLPAVVVEPGSHS